MQTKWLTAILLTLSTSQVIAQSQLPIEIGNVGSTRIAVSAGSGNQRIGNGVLTRILSINSQSGISTVQTALLACDGSWVSTTVQWTASLDKDKGFIELERYGKSKEQPIPLDAVDFPEGDAQYFYANVVSKRAAQICKSAGPEPRNIVLPVGSAKDTGDISTSIAILTGTSSKQGKVIDVWMRATDFKQIPHLDKDGNPVVYEGVTHYKKEVTGKYALLRTAFDCANRTYGIYESASYETVDAYPTVKSIPRNKLQFTSVLPNSIAEAELNMVCKLYG